MGRDPGAERGTHTALPGDRSRGLVGTLSVGRRAWPRVPFLELSAIWLLRRRLGLYLYDPEPYLDFWRGGPMAMPARHHHLLLTGPWILGFAITFLGQVGAAAVGRVLDVSGLDAGCPWAYLYTLIPLAFTYHLACALLAGRGTRGSAWRWTSSFPVEVALLLAAVPLSALA